MSISVLNVVGISIRAENVSKIKKMYTIEKLSPKLEYTENYIKYGVFIEMCNSSNLY